MTLPWEGEVELFEALARREPGERISGPSSGPSLHAGSVVVGPARWATRSEQRSLETMTG
jgi:hypothetical protein